MSEKTSRRIVQLDPACPESEDRVPGRDQAAGLVWIHVQAPEPDDRDWLERVGGLDPVTAELLTDPETRPRLLVRDDGLLLILRGLNVNPGNDPEDMVSVRVWCEPHRVFSVSLLNVASLQELASMAADKNAPRRAGAFCVALCEHLVDRIGGFTRELDEAVDALEDDVADENTPPPQRGLAQLRRQTIGIRRFLHPIAHVVEDLPEVSVSWLEPEDRAGLARIAHLALRYTEDLDASRDRLAILQDQALALISASMNRIMLVMSLVAVIFLPVTFLTGLFGMNVGGIPWSTHPQGFALACTLMGLVAGVAAALLWRRFRL